MASLVVCFYRKILLVAALIYHLSLEFPVDESVPWIIEAQLFRSEDSISNPLLREGIPVNP